MEKERKISTCGSICTVELTFICNDIEQVFIKISKYRLIIIRVYIIINKDNERTDTARESLQMSFLIESYNTAIVSH